MGDSFETRNSTFDIGASPDDGRKFTELYNVQHLQSAQLDCVSRVCCARNASRRRCDLGISTIQRFYSMLRFLFFWIENTDATASDHARRQAMRCACSTQCMVCAS